MKKIASLLFSNKLTVIVLLIFAISMAYATFVENDHGTIVARQAIYEAWWFEVLMLILALNFVGNIYRYGLLRKGKLSILLFHLAFIVILIGAFVSRYMGYEGLVHIREGHNTGHIISQERYVNIVVERADQQWEFNKQLRLTRFKQPDVTFSTGENDDALTVNIKKFVPDALQGLADGDETDEVIELVALTEGRRKDLYLGQGTSVFLNGHELTFNNQRPGAINITGSGGDYKITTPEALSYLVMATQRSGLLPESTTDTLRIKALYQSEHLNFAISKIHSGKKLDYQTTSDKELAKNAADLLFVELQSRSEQKNIILAAVDGVFSPLQETDISAYKVKLSYGPKKVSLPFSLHLSDFQLERYPGSTSPSSYASELVVQDGEGSFPVRVSMNNVLDYRGYRFFQASYDMDEQGTVLSVNKDFWGTQITYLGYFLMGIGMLLTLFGKNSRFMQISRKLNDLKLEKVAPVFILFILPTVTYSYEPEDEAEIGSITEGIIDKNHAATFGQLLVQDMDGRIKPVNTLALEFLRKLTRKTYYIQKQGGESHKLSADQVFLSIHHDPLAWQYAPLIHVDQEKGKMILAQLHKEGVSLLSFQDLLDDNGDYLLSRMVDLAQRKKPAERSESDKEVIKVDERFNILFQALSGNYLKIFPQPEEDNKAWFNDGFINAGFSNEDSVFVRNILKAYYRDIKAARITGKWAESRDKLLYIKTFQETMGSDLIPEDGRVQAELIYNELGIFNKLFPVYWMLGIYLLLTAILRVFFSQKILRITYLLGVWLVVFAFILQTVNMLLRWYAGGYPPWSNGYEMIILVSWALFLFGFIFYRKSDFILPVVALFGGTLLFVSYLDWLNPEITSLVPVLKSYWLKIHVAIIVSSYAPLALSALLGLISLVFMVVRDDRFSKPITELTYINELSMTIGLFMLAIGTFLGGVWANESWGRYWGWDPKETWALISIIVYAVVLHLRLIPKLRGEYTFNLASVLAFFSIIMTSFGVNYYLSGLHSYAAGDPLPIPQFVYWVVGSIFLLSVGAYWRNGVKAA